MLGESGWYPDAWGHPNIWGCQVNALKEVILNSFYFGRCNGHERTDFEQFLILGRCGGLERTGFSPFLLWDGVEVLKELILNSFYFGRVWWS